MHRWPSAHSVVRLSLLPHASPILRARRSFRLSTDGCRELPIIILINLVRYNFHDLNERLAIIEFTNLKKERRQQQQQPGPLHNRGPVTQRSVTKETRSVLTREMRSARNRRGCSHDGVANTATEAPNTSPTSPPKPHSPRDPLTGNALPELHQMHLSPIRCC
ncbi:unnamed protein product [Leptosia nina]|uniref:Uncharacterized protein n=1 Tax=Leptosia nina TaxID=320188 RepID=A0AAV1IU03_9NEOP